MTFSSCHAAGHLCILNCERGEAHVRGQQGDWLQRGQPFSSQYLRQNSPCVSVQSPVALFSDGTRPKLDGLLRFWQADVVSCRAWTAPTGDSPMGVPGRQTGSHVLAGASRRVLTAQREGKHRDSPPGAAKTLHI